MKRGIGLLTTPTPMVQEMKKNIVLLFFLLDLMPGDFDMSLASFISFLLFLLTGLYREAIQLSTSF